MGVALSAAGAPALAVQATSLTLMGSNAAADTYINARNRGATAKEAKENAIATFAIEVGTEVIPLDYLWKATKGIKYTTKPLVNVSIGAALEGTENVVSDLANRGVEDIIYGKSGYSEKNYLTELYQKELIAQGYSSEDAYKWAVQKEQLSFGKDVIKDGISGDVSGFVLNGIASGLASRGNVAAGSLEGDSKDGKYSAFGEMPEADGIRYRDWNYEKIKDISIHYQNSDTLTLGKYRPTIEIDGTENWKIAGPDSYNVIAEKMVICILI